MTDFFRFPSTPHLAWLGQGAPREDKVLDDAQVVELLSDVVIVEEKLDGANLGFSLDHDGRLCIQNRGQFLHAPFVGQFARLSDWLCLHGDDLRHALATHFSDDLVLFGEWCAARHSLNYSRLPDWFLLFDVYERRSNKFWSSQRRNHFAKRSGLATVPLVFKGHVDLPHLRNIVSHERSQFREGSLEGIVVRQDSAEWNESRAKLVRKDFTQAIDEHWSRRRLEWNRVDWSES